MQDKPLDDLKRLISLPMNSFPLGVGVIDRDLRLQYVNEQQARLNGFKVAETFGRHLADSGPSLAAAAGPKIQFFLDTGVPLRNQEPIGQPPFGDDSDRTLVRTIITMAQNLGQGVIAGGVETEEQRKLPHAMGCEHHQGYLFGRPLPIDLFEALVR